jgi:hypothetical protein
MYNFYWMKSTVHTFSISKFSSGPDRASPDWKCVFFCFFLTCIGVFPGICFFRETTKRSLRFISLKRQSVTRLLGGAYRGLERLCDHFGKALFFGGHKYFMPILFLRENWQSPNEQYFYLFNQFRYFYNSMIIRTQKVRCSFFLLLCELAAMWSRLVSIF